MILIISLCSLLISHITLLEPTLAGPLPQRVSGTHLLPASSKSAHRWSDGTVRQLPALLSCLEHVNLPPLTFRLTLQIAMYLRMGKEGV